MKTCTKCVLPETYPGNSFIEQGVCNFCQNHKASSNEENQEVKIEDEEIARLLQKYRRPELKYDVLVPVSGGVDSSAALINIVQKFKLRPLAFHNDHGYEDSVATDNVKKLCKKFDIDLIIWQHDIGFMKKMWKYVNESRIEDLSACYFCGNILYVNAMELADKFQIPLVINRYSKGQVLVSNSYRHENSALEKLIGYIQEVGDDEFVEQLMQKFNIINKQHFIDNAEQLRDEIPKDKISVMPFYIFKQNKTGKEALKAFCKEHFDWEQMDFTYSARSTNCKMICLNTYMDLQKMNYTVYHQEYSELVRAGEMTREQAMNDLAFHPQEGLIEELAKEIDVDLKIHEKKREEPMAKVSEEVNEIEFDF